LGGDDVVGKWCLFGNGVAVVSWVVVEVLNGSGRMWNWKVVVAAYVGMGWYFVLRGLS